MLSPHSGLLVGGVSMVRASRSELTQLVPDHILRHVNRDELSPVVDGKGQAKEVWRNRGTPRPGLDDLIATDMLGLEDLLKQMVVDERSLFD